MALRKCSRQGPAVNCNGKRHSNPMSGWRLTLRVVWNFYAQKILMSSVITRERFRKSGRAEIARDECPGPGALAISRNCLALKSSIIGTSSAGLNEVEGFQRPFSLLQGHRAEESD